MNRNLQARGSSPMSPIYERWPAAKLKALLGRVLAGPARSFARRGRIELAGWVDGLHRVPFTSVI